MADEKPSVEVIESYRDYAPSLPAKKIVERLLRYAPAEQLIGLKSVILRNASGLSHKERRAKTRSRGRKVKVGESLGTYRQKTAKRPAYIELFIDNMVSSAPKPVFWFSLPRYFMFGSVLYHEIGHHIHKTQRPKYKEKENVADEWAMWLTLRMLKRRYWYLVWILYVMRLFRKSYWRKRKERAKKKSE